MTDHEPDVLTAVDDLTKPFVRANYVGTDHEHEWEKVTRPTTDAEKAEWKRLKKPVRLKLETGEWWCQWCEAVATTRPEQTVPQRIDRQDDPPLLEQLENAVTSDIGGGGVGKLAHTRTPVDFGALTLYQAIDERVRSWIMTLGGRPGKGLSLSQLLRSWYVLHIGGTDRTDDARFEKVLKGWKTGILDIIDPPDQIPYSGQPCPLCGETRALVHAEAGVEDTVALWAVLRPEYRDEGSYGMCKACKEVIVRDTDPLRLRSRMNGAVGSGQRMTRTVGDEVGDLTV